MRRTYEASMLELTKMAAGADRVARAMLEGDADLGAMPAGQVSGRIEDIPSAAELIERIIMETEDVVQSLREKVFS